MWKKFKNWLIKKLGGFVTPTKEVIVNHYTRELNALSTTIRIDNRTLHNYPGMVYIVSMKLKGRYDLL